MKPRDAETLERQLVELRPQARAEFRQALRGKVLRASARTAVPANRTPRMSGVSGLWAVVTLGLLAALVIFFATPAGRSFAQQAIRLGVFYVTNNLSLAEQWIKDRGPDGDELTLRARPAELAEASAAAGFPVYYPTYLPSDYVPEPGKPIQIIYSKQGEVKSVEAMFAHPEKAFVLVYIQAPFPPEADLAQVPLVVGDAQVEEVTVQGQEALWLAGYVWGTERDDRGQLQPVEYNVLLWTLPAADGARFYFWLGSEEQLSMAEMLRIANSISAD